MTNISPHPLSFRPRPATRAGLEAYAKAKNVDLAEAVEALLVLQLIAGGWLTEDQRRQVVAETSLMAEAESMLTAVKKADDWGDDVTRVLFSSIQRDHESLHAEATANGETPRVHRNIGKLARKVLEAEVATENGKTKLVYVPRGSKELIGAYTPLHRRGKKVA